MIAKSELFNVISSIELICIKDPSLSIYFYTDYLKRQDDLVSLTPTKHRVVIFDERKDQTKNNEVLSKFKAIRRHNNIHHNMKTVVKDLTLLWKANKKYLKMEVITIPNDPRVNAATLLNLSSDWEDDNEY